MGIIIVIYFFAGTGNIDKDLRYQRLKGFSLIQKKK